MDEEEQEQISVLGEPLQTCSTRPMTGFTRSGCCDYLPVDAGQHTICVQVTAEFLEFSRFRGNDLSTPIPEFAFPRTQARRSLVPVRGALEGSAGVRAGTQGRSARHPPAGPRGSGSR